VIESVRPNVSYARAGRICLATKLSIRILIRIIFQDSNGVFGLSLLPDFMEVYPACYNTTVQVHLIIS
jgi:hypothetical protein